MSANFQNLPSFSYYNMPNTNNNNTNQGAGF